MMNIIHRDHGITDEQIAWVQQYLADLGVEGFFLETITLPERLGSVMNRLHGPVCGDAAVKEQEVHYEKRGDRPYADRMCKRAPRETQDVVAIGIWNVFGEATLFTCYGGPVAPQHAEDETNKDPEASKAFWAIHALTEM